MFSFYRRKMSHFVTPSESIRSSNIMLIDKTFRYDPAYSIALINNEPIEIKFLQSTTYSADRDISPNAVQFRPNVKKQIGTIIDIPEYEYDDFDYDIWKDEELQYRARYIASDGKHYRRWLIVEKQNQQQFSKYYVVPCDWCLKWIYDGKLYKQLGSLKAKGSYSNGVTKGSYINTLEGQEGIWLPLNEVTKTLTYDQRVLISLNEIHPQAYKIKSISTTHPIGILNISLNITTLENDDDYKNMIANASSLNFETGTPDKEHEFCFMSSNKTLYLDNYIELTAYENNGNGMQEITNFQDNYKWGFELENKEKTQYIMSNQLILFDEKDSKFTISCKNSISLLGEKIIITLTNNKGEVFTQEFSILK